MSQCLVLLCSRPALPFAISSTCKRMLFSSLAVRVAVVKELEDDKEELYPNQNLTLSIPYPSSLSPSSIMEFQKCPQSFLFQYLWGLKQPTTPVLAKGSMCHAALEQIFDLEPPHRTLENLQNLFRKEWSIQKQKDTYKDLFCDPQNMGEWNVQDEREWGLSGLRLLQNYVELEDPRQLQRPNPVQREIWVRAHLNASGRPRNSQNSDAESGNSTTEDETFLVRGIVDRLDMIQIPSANYNPQIFLRLVDYKSGKAPQFKYSKAMNAKIADEAFFQLKIYALLFRESRKEGDFTSRLDLRTLRLLYLTSEDERKGTQTSRSHTEGPARYLDFDLGATAEERNQILDDLYMNLADTWKQIKALVDTQDPLQFHGCDRSFCWCHHCRPQFVPGSVWEPRTE